jgi:hypothetical protein
MRTRSQPDAEQPRGGARTNKKRPHAVLEGRGRPPPGHAAVTHPSTPTLSRVGAVRGGGGHRRPAGGREGGVGGWHAPCPARNAAPPLELLSLLMRAYRQCLRRPPAPVTVLPPFPLPPSQASPSAWTSPWGHTTRARWYRTAGWSKAAIVLQNPGS